MSDREKNILDEGVKNLERVIVNEIHGQVIGVDFLSQSLLIRINVPAYMVKREREAE